ncbi:tetraspanin 35 isoform X1 [Danio rerio]|uniref:Tetraspanin 35 isoform X1 n=1 Tax=Danio rerio TaxID=7955 RepID=A0AC58IHL9_DANRE
MGCFGFLKTMMFLFNGIIFLAGGVILGVGIWVKVDNGSILNFMQSLPGASSQMGQVLNVGYLLIALGAVLVVLGFLGCCGAIKESRCMLMLFFIIILIIFIAEVAGAIVILAFRPLAETLIKQLGVDAVKSLQSDFGKNQDVTGLWNTTMTGMKCCGFNNYTDFTNSYFVNSTKNYPVQCCNTSPCNQAAVMNSTVTGCFPALIKLVDKNAVIIIAVALGIAALELAAMIVSMVLYCKIGSKA